MNMFSTGTVARYRIEKKIETERGKCKDNWRFCANFSGKLFTRRDSSECLNQLLPTAS
jgi:hypothetical protein